MSTQQELFAQFEAVASHPKRQLDSYKAEGKKVIGVLPYYVPEELVHASGMIPMGLWGSNNKTITKAKEYCATFYCTIAQLALEMLLDGTMDGLDGIITPTICDTLRPMSQNFRVAMEGKLPCIFLAQPQNRRPEFGIQFSIDQFTHVKTELEKISGTTITDENLANSIKLYNQSRKARREFSKLAGTRGVSAVNRSSVFRASWFMTKEEHTKLLVELNSLLAASPEVKVTRGIVTSGIICDNPKLLQLIDENGLPLLLMMWR
ncbi:MAG: 2-hydroxyacyl-CoA dehydratase family protein, partial [Eubacteriales bacterium]